MKYYLVTISLLWLCSCVSRQNNVVTVDRFPCDTTLTSEIVEVPPVLLYPGHTLTVGDKLVVYENKRETLFDVFQLPECRYLYSGGLRGRGPGEFPTEVDRRSFLPVDGGFEVVGLDMCIRRVEIGDSEIGVTDGFRLRGQMTPNGLYRLGSGVYVAWEAPGGNNEYAIINTATGAKRAFGTYPDLAGRPLTVSEQMFAYIKNSVVKPDGSRFASFYSAFKFWRLYDSEGNLLREIQVTEGRQAPGVLPHDPAMWFVAYASYPMATDDYIYILCENRLRNEPFPATSELQVWDWEGSLIGRYELDQPIILFAISQRFKQLYGVTGSDIDRIYVYPLPGYGE